MVDLFQTNDIQSNTDCRRARPDRNMVEVAGTDSRVACLPLALKRNRSLRSGTWTRGLRDIAPGRRLYSHLF